MKFTFSAIIVLSLVYSAICSAGENLVVLSCSVTDEWLEKSVETSTRVPRPNKSEVANKLNEVKLKSIQITFYSDDETLGIGTLLGEQTPYFITDGYIMYMTADDKGSKNSILDRYSGIFYLNLGLPISYACKQQGRRF